MTVPTIQLGRKATVLYRPIQPKIDTVDNYVTSATRIGWVSGATETKDVVNVSMAVTPIHEELQQRHNPAVTFRTIATAVVGIEVVVRFSVLHHSENSEIDITEDFPRWIMTRALTVTTPTTLAFKETDAADAAMIIGSFDLNVWKSETLNDLQRWEVEAIADDYFEFAPKANE